MNKEFSIILLILIFLTACASAPREKSMKFGMQAILTAVQGKGDDLADIMLRASKVVSELEGCELYLVQQLKLNFLRYKSFFKIISKGERLPGTNHFYLWYRLATFF